VHFDAGTSQQVHDRDGLDLLESLGQRNQYA